MRIFAINRFYKPDHSATSQLLTDLAEHLAAGGADVHVIASRNLYQGRVRLAGQQTIANVKIHRVWTSNFGRAWLPGRMFDYATFYLSSFFKLWFALRAGDVLVAKTDPPLISVVAAIAAKMRGAVLVNWCQDLFPEVAAATGLTWTTRFGGNVLGKVRNWSLKAAALNVVLHERMAEKLGSLGIDRDSVAVLPNWADRSIKPIAHADNPLRSEWALQDRVVIGYSGNLGRVHMPEIIAELVRSTLDIENLTWLFIGGGHGVDAVKKAAAGSPNVLFKPYQPREKLSASLSVCDAHLVSLNPDCEGLVVPSKLYGALAVGRPVLSLSERDGAVARDVRSLNAGWVLDPKKPDEWRSAVEVIVRELSSGRAATSAASNAEDAGGLALAAWASALSQCDERGTGHAATLTGGPRR